MSYLNSEYLFSLIYRHRDENGQPTYLDHFQFEKEPFQLFPTKVLSATESTDRFLFHATDLVEQNKPLLMMLSRNPWYSKATFAYMNSQIRILLPQNFDVHVIDLGDAKPSKTWLLKKMLRSCGIDHVEKEDSANIKKFRNHNKFKWSEYKMKQYFVLFRSDNLSFQQLKFFRDLIVTDENKLPLTYFLLEGSKETYHSMYDMRKESISDLIYDTFFILHRGSFDTVQKNVSDKLGMPAGELFSQPGFRKLFYITNGQPIFPLLHTILARMATKKLKKIGTELALDEILSETQHENDEFIARAPEYKKRLEKKDYIFPPELLRDGPSITEARRFFKWMGWEE